MDRTTTLVAFLKCLERKISLSIFKKLINRVLKICKSVIKVKGYYKKKKLMRKKSFPSNVDQSVTNIFGTFYLKNLFIYIFKKLL